MLSFLFLHLSFVSEWLWLYLLSKFLNLTCVKCCTWRINSLKNHSQSTSRKQYFSLCDEKNFHHFSHKYTENKMVSIMMSTTSAFISSPTTLKLRKKSNTNKRSNNSLLKIAKAISVADVTGPVKETIKDVQSVEVQNTMRFSFSRENSKNNCANSWWWFFFRQH